MSFVFVWEGGSLNVLLCLWESGREHLPSAFFLQQPVWLHNTKNCKVTFVCLSAHSQVSCPYSETNLNKEGLVPDRLSGERPLALSGLPPRGRRTDPQTNSTLQSNSAPLQTEGAVEPQNRFAPERTAGHVFTKQEQTLKARQHSYWGFCVPT